jgi:signal peptidase I
MEVDMKILLTALAMLIMTVSGYTTGHDLNKATEFSRKDNLILSDYLEYASFSHKAFRVPSGSMANTILAGDRIIVDKAAYLYNKPERFDIIVFTEPDREDLSVKRIIGLSGETLEIKDGLVYINNSTECLDEPYLVLDYAARDYGPYIIPDNQYFIMGDYRDHSFDSRVWQDTYLPFESIFGKVILVSTTE